MALAYGALWTRHPSLRWAGFWVILVYSAFMVGLDSFRARGANASFRFYFQNQAAEEVRTSIQQNEPFRVALMGTFHPAYMQSHGLGTVGGYINIYPLRYKHFWAVVIEESAEGTPWRNYFMDLGNRVYLFSKYPEGGERASFEFDEVKFNLNLLRLANVKYLFSQYPVRRPEDQGLLLFSSPEPENLARFKDMLTVGQKGWRLGSLRVLLDSWFREQTLLGLFCAGRLATDLRGL